MRPAGTTVPDCVTARKVTTPPPPLKSIVAAVVVLLSMDSCGFLFVQLVQLALLNTAEALPRKAEPQTVVPVGAGDGDGPGEGLGVGVGSGEGVGAGVGAGLGDGESPLPPPHAEITSAAEIRRMRGTASARPDETKLGFCIEFPSLLSCHQRLPQQVIDPSRDYLTRVAACHPPQRPPIAASGYSAAKGTSTPA